MPTSPKRPARSTTSWTTPQPTDVLAYSYLWHDEAEAGREEGVKDRPVVVVLAAETKGGRTQLTVAPLTTQPPRGTGHALEVPPRVRAHLGLDTERCWVVCTEVNRFTWPGPDVRIAKGRRTDATPFYGKMPGKLFEQVRRLLAAHAGRGSLRSTGRTE